MHTIYFGHMSRTLLQTFLSKNVKPPSSLLSVIKKNNCFSSLSSNTNPDHELTANHKPHLLLEKRNNIRWITMNRPKQLNAWSLQMFQEFIDALKEAEADDDIRMSIITGSGHYFTSGADLSKL